jgi:hypothetical protein
MCLEKTSQPPLSDEVKELINVAVDTSKVDHIRIDLTGAHKLLEWRNANKDLVRKCVFTLREGIILFGDHGRMYQYFLSPSGGEEGMMIVMAFLHGSNKPAEPISTFYFTASEEAGVQVQEQWTHERFAKIAGVSPEDGIEDAITVYFSLMAYMAFYKEVRERVQVEQKSFISKIKKPRHGKKSKRVVRAHRVEYNISFPEEVAEPREFERHVESWTVKGHPRVYKSGKTIFIQPFVKGKGKIESKTYQV